MPTLLQRSRCHLTVSRSLLVALALCGGLFVASCGGGQGGPGPNGAGQGLVLTTFEQDAVDNLALNSVLSWIFSEPVDPASVNSASIQLRRGGQFGASVPGSFRVVGNQVFFEPQLPGLCDLSDAGFKADTQYRVQLIGWPEEFSIKNTRGQPLSATSTYEFHTRAETDPERFLDQIAAFSPAVTGISPANGAQAVTVDANNRIVVTFSENLDPCTVNDTTVLFHMVETGDPVLGNARTAPNGNASGFYTGSSTADNSASAFSWGADVSTTVAPAQRVLATIRLVQTFAVTQIVITPTYKRFPENALLLLRLTTGIKDFGGLSLPPLTASFTTQNLPVQTGSYAMLVEGETPFSTELSTGEFNTARSPSKAQAFLLFAGDGDNGVVGAVFTDPTGPNTPASGCSSPIQGNDGAKDDFDPGTDATLDTGASVNTCPNDADGSTAVFFEFRTMRIRSGVTVRVIGKNPAILKVQGDAIIENGGRLLVRGDNQNGAPQSNGLIGKTGGTAAAGSAGGVGVAGGGDGGQSKTANGSQGVYGGDGYAGFGSPGVGVQGGTGGGQGNVDERRSNFNGGGSGHSAAGGGGGHAIAGNPGDAQETLPNSPFQGTPRGAGGGTYPTVGNAMRKPSAGSGGGAGGAAQSYANSNFNSSGGSGGAGGGFVDITSQGQIGVFGAIDASGGRGGNGILPTTGGFYHGSSAGGGGSGGGVRLLTPQNINVLGGTITTAGGIGGTGSQATNQPGPINNGGAGGSGRIVLEDGDSVITGLSGGGLTPGEGTDGFYRDVFDATRFQGGGLEPQVVSEVFPIGPFNPIYQTPVQIDFVAGVPSIASRGFGSTAIFIEAQGYEILPNGLVDLGSATGWKTVGHFKDSGSENLPQWVPNTAPADVVLPGDNTGGTIASLNGREFIQLRFSFYLPTGIGPFDAGPFLDTWIIRFSSDQ